MLSSDTADALTSDTRTSEPAEIGYESAMAELVLGPLLRYVGGHIAVFWVETDAPCEVRGAGRDARARSRSEGHHYGVVQIREPRAGHHVRVRGRARRRRGLAAEGVRLPAQPASAPTADDEQPADRLRLVPRGGAQRAALHADQGRGRPRPRASTPCARSALRMRDEDPDDWPDLLLLLGDQVYADECSPETRSSSAARRDTNQEPGDIALDFEEYCKPLPRVLGRAGHPLAAVHGVHGHDLRRPRHPRRLEHLGRVARGDARKTDWWDEHIIGALISYWIYQHVGNLSPDEQDEDGLLDRLQRRSSDGTRCCASSRADRTASAAAAAGAFTATSAARASW